MEDMINGLFETLGFFFILPSIFKLHREKVVRGVSWIHSGFFMTWGLWNLYYYPALEQWLSFFGGLLLVSANIVWWCQMIYYIRKEKREDMECLATANAADV